MYFSGVFIIAFLTNLSLCNYNNVEVVTRINDYMINPSDGFNICCPRGTKNNFFSKIYLTKPGPDGFPIVKGEYTATFHFPAVKNIAKICTTDELDDPTTSSPWIYNIKSSQTFYVDRFSYNRSVGKYAYKDIFISYLGFCTKHVDISELKDGKPFTMKFIISDSAGIGWQNYGVVIRCPDPTKLEIDTAFIKGSQFFNRGNAFDVTDQIKKQCDGKDHCFANITRATFDSAKISGQDTYKVAFVVASCKTKNAQ